MLHIGICAAIALLAAGTGAAPALTSPAASAAGCSGPVLHDRYDGFHIGVPAGWNLATLGGIIAVYQDPGATIEAIVSPAILTRTLTPARLFAATASELSKIARSDGNRLVFKITGTKGGLPQATVSGHAGNSPISGVASVFLLPEATAHGSQLAVFSGYWARTARLAAERSKLAAVGACYGPQPGTLFRIVKDAAFTYPIPPGWTVSEGTDNLFVSQGPDASANYIFWRALTSSEGVTDDQSMLRYTLAKVGITIGSVIGTVSLPNTTTAAGGTSQVERVEFLGTLNGSHGLEHVHVIATVVSTSGAGISSGAVRLAIATTNLWNSLRGALILVTNGIQHDFAQDDAELRQVQQQLESFGQQVQGFDYALNGNDLVQNTATGEQFEAPYSAFDQSGPDGPGYYSGSPGNLQKLNVITPQ